MALSNTGTQTRTCVYIYDMYTYFQLVFCFSGNCIRTLGYQSAPINSIDRDSTRIVSVTDNGILSILDFNPIRSLHCNSPSVSGPDCATISKNEAKANLMISQHRSLLKHKQKMMLLNTKHQIK